MGRGLCKVRLGLRVGCPRVERWLPAHLRTPSYRENVLRDREELSRQLDPRRCRATGQYAARSQQSIVAFSRCRGDWLDSDSLTKVCGSRRNRAHPSLHVPIDYRPFRVGPIKPPRLTIIPRPPTPRHGRIGGRRAKKASEKERKRGHSTFPLSKESRSPLDAVTRQAEKLQWLAWTAVHIHIGRT